MATDKTLQRTTTRDLLETLATTQLMDKHKGEPVPIPEIASAFNLTPRRIIQIQNEALSKIKPLMEGWW